MDELKEDEMMPLTMANVGETNVIEKIGGKEETRRFLENLRICGRGRCYRNF